MHFQMSWADYLEDTCYTEEEEKVQEPIKNKIFGQTIYPVYVLEANIKKINSLIATIYDSHKEIEKMVSETDIIEEWSHYIYMSRFVLCIIYKFIMEHGNVHISSNDNLKEVAWKTYMCYNRDCYSTKFNRPLNEIVNYGRNILSSMDKLEQLECFDNNQDLNYYVQVIRNEVDVFDQFMSENYDPKWTPGNECPIFNYLLENYITLD